VTPQQQRLDHLAACQAAAKAKAAPVYTPAPLPDGHDEIMASHPASYNQGA
jgi:hypothetical protein